MRRHHRDKLRHEHDKGTTHLNLATTVAIPSFTRPSCFTALIPRFGRVCLERITSPDIIVECLTLDILSQTLFIRISS